MRYFWIVPLLLFFASPQEPASMRAKINKLQQRNSQTARQPASPGQPGTEEKPLVVKTIPPDKTQEEAAQDAKDRQEKASNDRKLVEFTRDLAFLTGVLTVIGFLQLIVFGYQAKELRRTVEAAAGQSEAMERSIREANRLASAMEGIAEDIEVSSKAAMDSVAALRERTAQQMRAYLTVIIGAAIYQERRKGLRFEGKPILVNTGHTPARNVSYVARAAILPVPLPEDFRFPLPNELIGSSVLGSQQNAILSGVVEDFCPDNEVQDIKAGNGKALYVWGVVHYKDIFDEARTTKFCQTLLWQKNGQIFGYYIPRHNEAT